MKKILCTIFFATGLTSIYAQWNEITSPYTGNLSAIKFFDTNTGYIGGNTAILKTTDGGDSWTSMPISAFSINNFSFPDETVGYFAANNSIIAKTTDQGINWVNNDLGLSPFAFLSVNFISASIGYGVGSAGIIRKTTDGGTSWAAQSSGTTANLREVYFFDANDGVFIGDAGTIKRTTNGGSTWLTVASGTTDNLYDLHFVNTSTGFIAAGNGTILKTTNGGASWTSLVSGTTEFLYAVCFKNVADGYVAGANGTILKTTDGGTTWTAEVSGVSTDGINDLVYINGHFMAITNSGKILTNEISSNVGIDQVSVDELSVNLFPNPASDLVSLYFNNPSASPLNILIFNANGTLVQSELLTENNQTFNITNLTNGVYFVRITNGEGVIDKKLVVQK
jgi:photosystem II stability/assembly factor-like uncharacterized protein